MADAPRPLAITLAGRVLIADAAISAVVILFNAVADTPTPMAVRAAGTLTLLGVALVESWIGRGVLNRRRWWLGIGIPGIFLLLAIAFPPWADDPPLPPASLVYGIAAMLAWMFVVVALVWHRPLVRRPVARGCDRLNASVFLRPLPTNRVGRGSSVGRALD